MTDIQIIEAAIVVSIPWAVLVLILSSIVNRQIGIIRDHSERYERLITNNDTLRNKVDRLESQRYEVLSALGVEEDE